MIINAVIFFSDAITWLILISEATLYVLIIGLSVSCLGDLSVGSAIVTLFILFSFPIFSFNSLQTDWQTKSCRLRCCWVSGILNQQFISNIGWEITVPHWEDSLDRRTYILKHIRLIILRITISKIK